MAANQKLTRVIAGRSVARVQQDDAVLTLEFSDGSRAEIKLEAVTSSVMVRDTEGKLGAAVQPPDNLNIGRSPSSAVFRDEPRTRQCKTQKQGIK